MKFVVIFIFALFITLSILSYDSTDPFFDNPTGSAVIHNWGGLAGAHLANFLLVLSVFLFGDPRTFVIGCSTTTLGLVLGGILVYRKANPPGTGYIDRNLMPGEEVIYRTKLHWIVFLWPMFFLILAVAGFVGISAKVGLLFSMLAAGVWLVLCVTYATTEFGVTNKRVVVKVGFVRRDTVETLLAKVEGIGVHQDILGRILGYGTVFVTGTGGSKEPFRYIEAPLEFRRQVHEQIAAEKENKSH